MGAGPIELARERTSAAKQRLDDRIVAGLPKGRHYRVLHVILTVVAHVNWPCEARLCTVTPTRQ